jgi:hypothetical protein
VVAADRAVADRVVAADRAAAAVVDRAAAADRVVAAADRVAEEADRVAAAAEGVGVIDVAQTGKLLRFAGTGWWS